MLIPTISENSNRITKKADLFNIHLITLLILKIISLINSNKKCFISSSSINKNIPKASKSITFISKLKSLKIIYILI